MMIVIVRSDFGSSHLNSNNLEQVSFCQEVLHNIFAQLCDVAYAAPAYSFAISHGFGRRASAPRIESDTVGHKLAKFVEVSQ